jgi:hypothetical protein
MATLLGLESSRCLLLIEVAVKAPTVPVQIWVVGMPRRILQYPMLSLGAPSSGRSVQDGEVEDTQLDAAEELPSLSWAELTVLYADGVRQFARG